MSRRIAAGAFLLAAAAGCGIRTGGDGTSLDAASRIGMPCSTNADCPSSTQGLPVTCVYKISDRCDAGGEKTCEQHPACFSVAQYYACSGGIVTVACPSDGFTVEQVVGPVPSFDAGLD